MSDSPDMLARLAGELAAILDPLVAALDDPIYLLDFLRDLGWNPTAAPQPLLDLLTDASDLLAILDGDAEPDGLALVAKVSQLLGRIDQLAGAGSGAFPVAGAATFLQEFPGQLVRHLLGTHVLRRWPLVAAVLRLTGSLVIEHVPAAPPRLAYRRIELRPEAFVQSLTSPLAAVRTALDWGLDPLDVTLLMDVTRVLLGARTFPVRTAALSPTVLAQLGGGPATPQRYRYQNRVFLLDTMDEDGVTASLGFGVAPVPAEGTAPPGLAVLPFANAGLGTTLELDDHLGLVVDAEGELTGLGLVVRPGRPPQVLTGLGGPTAPAGALALSFGIQNRRRDGEPTIVVGDEASSWLGYTSLSAVGGFRSRSGTSSVFVTLELGGGRLRIKPGDAADSFLGKLLPADGFEIELDLALDLDSVAGLTFKGSGGLQQRFPTHLSLGPVSFDGVTLALKPDGQSGTLQFEAGADLRGELGPLKAVVENVGLWAWLDPTVQNGNLGPVNLWLGFKPPNGVGLSIDAAVVKGGGYLFLDYDKGEYAGALELSIAGLFSVNAIGLITTRLPDGTPGFSLLVILTAEFTPGLQLSFGFTLLGVGGLVGLNRMARLDALAQGVRTGALDNVLFPRDVVANAPRILSDLRTIFPARQGTFLIGPMVKLGWGTPTLVSLSLGVIVEIPGNLAILGVLKLALPTEDAALIQLKVSFVGAIELDRKRVWFFASLFDSRVLLFPLDGEMGLLMAWGEDPNFVLSVGGFHPAFSPPPLPFPSPNRVGITILNAPGQRIVATGYFAVTSNTAQFGARVEVVLGFSDFGVQGHIGFDALFRFSPFSFLIDASASFALQAFGADLFSVRLALTLEGPAPWRARGRGSVSLLFFEISADFDITWGESRNTIAPPVAVLELVRQELAKAESWTAELPAGSTGLGVTLRPLTPGSDVVLHPRGTLRVSQRAVPLALDLDRVGQRAPSDVRSVRIGSVTGGLQPAGDATEKFAAAQFLALTDAQKLARPAFESYPGGTKLQGASALAATRSVARSARYEQIVIDSFGRRSSLRLLGFNAHLFDVLLANNSAARSALAQAPRVIPDDVVTVAAGGGFVVADRFSNRAAGDHARFATEAEAHQFLADTAAADPAGAAGLHVIAAFEEAVA